ncbi:MAG: hypothetical protein H0W88_01590 [Parachlamydiaceae bacterium]|nr:hypothetical protein [Parachlamydiaceae bacterium]
MILKKFDKWLLAGILAFTPYLSINATASENTFDDKAEQSSDFSGRRKFKPFDRRPQLQYQINTLLVGNTADFRDLAYFKLQGFSSEISDPAQFSYALALIKIDKQIGELIGSFFPNDQEVAVKFQKLFTEFNTRGIEFVVALSELGIVIPQLKVERAAWIAQAKVLAKALGEINPEQLDVKTATRLLVKYTNLLADMCIALNNNNYPEANNLFTESRFGTIVNLGALLTLSLLDVQTDGRCSNR